MLPQWISRRRMEHLELITDPILENYIPEVFYKFTHSVYIGVILLVANGAGAVGQGLQFIADALESWCLMKVDVHSR